MAEEKVKEKDQNSIGSLIEELEPDYLNAKYFYRTWRSSNVMKTLLSEFSSLIMSPQEDVAAASDFNKALLVACHLYSTGKTQEEIFNKDVLDKIPGKVALTAEEKQVDTCVSSMFSVAGLEELKYE